MIFARTPVASGNTPDDKEKAAFETKYRLNHRQRQTGETDKQYGDRLASEIKDKRDFLIDFTTQEMQHRTPTTAPVVLAQLEDLHVSDDGLTATGKAVRHGADGSTTSSNLKFKKLDGSWKLDDLAFF